MKRRQFILGAVAAAVSAALPAKAVLLHDAAHHDIIGGFGLAPIKAEGASVAYDYQTFKLGYEGSGVRYASALAKSLMQTKEQVTADVLGRVFDSGEGARRSVGGGGSPDRV